jgi:hypothetical protein
MSGVFVGPGDTPAGVRNVRLRVFGHVHAAVDEVIEEQATYLAFSDFCYTIGTNKTRVPSSQNVCSLGDADSLLAFSAQPSLALNSGSPRLDLQPLSEVLRTY